MKKIFARLVSTNPIASGMSRWGRFMFRIRGIKLQVDHKLPPFPGRTAIVAYDFKDLYVLFWALKALGTWPESINDMKTPTAASCGPFLLIKPKDMDACAFMQALIALGPIRVVNVHLTYDETNEKKLHAAWTDVTFLFVEEAEGRRISFPERAMQGSFDTLSIPPEETKKKAQKP